MIASGFTWDNLLVTAVAAVLLAFTKVPAPLIVLSAFGAGFVG